ncbi:MarR family transcriptional regulator [Gilvimarinus agarilyticus]|uniref:MarR family winged helix-turn-helix transcriptional regulator n=1 Tax=unclassified Gilvimarinus TaxID=2642066 RepID=UPI001C087F82|nr:MULTISPECIES: MarR family transcriptional regulator [unclassified Gilvimarinus]MBU2885174.1 MarR family transcriptional regulator [Gilvimarinus agarilyticus]MDO6570073.1 MarR family transcriptional regulator [Gilvimarinus sp. 2_MG-2023]MDO6745624.1 MarR family transcriptional regulator [Gilvimarinus sp. 1_MG-2023]
MDKIEEVLVALRRVIRATDLHSKKLVKTASVTGPQLLLMQILNNKGDMTISELARDMSLSQATVTTVLDRLEKRELITRVRSQQDKRKVYPQLTHKGAKILESAPTALQDDFVRRFKHLEEWEQGMIIASLQRVAKMMDAHTLDASPFLDVGALDRGELLDRPN